MTVTGEMVGLVIVIVASLFTGFAWISGKLEAIKDQIAAIDKNSVSHEVCSKRQESCPCVQQMHELKSELKEQTQKLKIRN